MTRLSGAEDLPAVRRRGAAVAGALAVTLFGLLMWGGYGMGWRWTGLSESVTLWDWLEVLALPAAVATAPLLLRHRRRLSRRHRTILVGAVAAFAALALAGYAIPLSWTGFPGNTLWDWLELILLPLVVATSSLWVGLRQLRRRQLAAVALVGALFCALAVAGYLVPLSWTGFTGNTVWDWIKLLLLPLLVPTVLVPLVAGRITERLAPADGSVRRATRFR